MENEFDLWMLKVDSWLECKCGMTSESLPDIDYYTRWADGESPRITAIAAIKNAQEWVID
jgi:hypothetical protein